MPPLQRFIFVTGGVISGVGKGTVTASIARILKEAGFKIGVMKFDGYLNVDAGTLNPYEHGEVYVLDDGTECDEDLGHYERMLNENLSGKISYLTGGKVLLSILERERKGEYLGKTVQFIPHVVRWVIDHLQEVSKNFEIFLVEVGGSVGDWENWYMIEAARRMKNSEDYRVCIIHVGYVFVPPFLKEPKTRPLQRSVSQIRSLGLNPDILVVRSDIILPPYIIEKIRVRCGIKNVFQVPTYDIYYKVPIVLSRQGILEPILQILDLEKRKDGKLDNFISFCKLWSNCKRSVKIAIIGKYTRVPDAYLSIIEALKHTTLKLGYKPDITLIEATDYENKEIKEFPYDGCIIPGGFGKRAAEGKMRFIEYCRKNKIPVLGLCWGLQLMAIEYARNVCGMERANTTEIDPETPHPVVDLMPEQRDIDKLGGTMRLGSMPVRIVPNTLLHKIYQKELVYERHRHRWEVNPKYFDILRENGLVFSAWSEDGKRVEAIELGNHPFFLGVQFHPEFKSRPENPHPIFVAFAKACIEYSQHR